MASIVQQHGYWPLLAARFPSNTGGTSGEGDADQDGSATMRKTTKTHYSMSYRSRIALKPMSRGN